MDGIEAVESGPQISPAAVNIARWIKRVGNAEIVRIR
jgi:hypothetical protein